MTSSTLRKFTASGCLAIGCLFFSPSLKADDMAYLLAGTGELTNPFGIVDLNTGAFNLIGSLGGSGTLAGLGVANGTLYTERYHDLYSVNTSNASLTFVGTVTNQNLGFAAFGSTTTGLYAISQVGSNSVVTLFSINPLTGDATSIGALGAIGNGGAAYLRLSTNSGTLYMENPLGNLYTVNTTTGAATLVGTDSNSIFDQALLFENGTLYGGDDASGAHGPTVDRINTTTGQITIGAATSPVTTFGALAPYSLSTPTPSPAPEPATLLLFGLGLGSIGLLKRRINKTR